MQFQRFQEKRSTLNHLSMRATKKVKYIMARIPYYGCKLKTFFKEYYSLQTIQNKGNGALLARGVLYKKEKTKIYIKTEGTYQFPLASIMNKYKKRGRLMSTSSPFCSTFYLFLHLSPNTRCTLFI